MKYILKSKETVFYTSKGQAALEFLTVYAWAFIVILVTIGGLYYFGVFDFAKFRPQSCTFTSQFDCIDYALIGNEVRFRLVNNVGADVLVENVNVTDDSFSPLTCTPPTQFNWSNGQEVDVVLTNCVNGVFISEEFARLKVTVTYYAFDTPSQPRHTIRGRIDAIVR